MFLIGSGNTTIANRLKGSLYVTNSVVEFSKVIPYQSISTIQLLFNYFVIDVANHMATSKFCGFIQTEY
jgi:hypothetical protein